MKPRSSTGSPIEESASTGGQGGWKVTSRKAYALYSVQQPQQRQIPSIGNSEGTGLPTVFATRVSRVRVWFPFWKPSAIPHPLLQWYGFPRVTCHSDPALIIFFSILQSGSQVRGGRLPKNPPLPTVDSTRNGFFLDFWLLHFQENPILHGTNGAREPSAMPHCRGDTVSLVTVTLHFFLSTATSTISS